MITIIQSPEGRPCTGRSGLTRIEIVAVLAALALVAALSLPALAGNRERSAKLVCLSNLRHLGQALQQWGTEHDNRYPWRTPYCQGGTTLLSTSPDCAQPGQVPPVWFSGGLQHSAWFQWYWLSNQLGSPKALVCPSDQKKFAATEWSYNTNGGFLAGQYRNNAVSYFLGLDTYVEQPAGFVSGDLNLKFLLSGGGGGCSSGIRYNAAFAYYEHTPATISRLHGESGNYLFTDGRVEEHTGRTLVKRYENALADLSSELGSLHFMIPN